MQEKRYPLENLLRPPIEWQSSIVCWGVSALIFFSGTDVLFMPFFIRVMAINLFLLGLYRGYQGWQVIRYQRHLKQLPHYTLSSNELPINDQKIFLGKGFKWEAKHTQRLYDLKQFGAEKYLKPGKFYNWARWIQLNCVNSTKCQWLARYLSSPSRLNSLRSQAAIGGNPALHGVELYEAPIFLNTSERVGHTMILGTTRVGKTRLLELMIASDIRRQDSAVIVFDPKGDLTLLKRLCYEAKQVGRAQEVLIFHLGYPTHSARYNPIGHFARVTEVANRVANQLPGSGESATFREFAWRFVNIIANALVALGKTPSYKAMDCYILNIDPLLLDYCSKCLPELNEHWREEVEQIATRIDEKKLPFHLKSRNRFMIALIEYVDRLKLENPIYAGLKAIFNYDQTYFQKITASLSPLFAKLTTGRIAELISPNYLVLDDTRPIFNWLQVIRGKKIVYVGLDALSDNTVSTAVGNSMFADLCSTVGQIYKYGVQEKITNTHHPKTLYKVNVYSDEFIPLANKGGGAGLQLTVATQTSSDVLARLGCQAKANQVFGNFNSLICLRVLEENTARLLTDKLSQHVQVRYRVPASSVNDQGKPNQGSYFSSHTEDRLIVSEVPLMDTDVLMQLPKGQAFCLLEGGQLYKVRFPLPKNDMQEMPEDVEGMIASLKIL